MEFENVKKIEQKKRDIVFGYIRRCESLLEDNQLQIDGPIGYSILLFYHETLDSKILDADEIRTLMSMFNDQNKFNDIGAFEYKLLYASYTHGDGENIFKKMCDNKRNLLVFVHTEDNNVFGGYTSVGWKPPKEMNISCSIKDEKAFIFSIRTYEGSPPRIFNVINPENALRYQGGFYCMFGMIYCCWIGHRGRSGGTHISEADKEYLPEYERIPPNYSSITKREFNVNSIEVFQLCEI